MASRKIGRSSILGKEMNGHFDETRHVIYLGIFENKKRYKEQTIREIVTAICAMLNSNGGKVVIDFETDSNETPVGGSPFSQMSLVIRILEQCMLSIIGLYQTISNMDFIEDKESIIILVKKVDYLITIDYNLYLPSRTQVVHVSSLEPIERVKDDIIDRKVSLESVLLRSHCKIFRQGTICDVRESKTVQFKHLEAQATRRTTLADRIIGKGNKFSMYVSAHANHTGGHIYYGINDHGLVIGEVIENEEDKQEITKKVEKAIKKMIWPEHVGQPKRGEQWDIFFEPVVDKDNKPIPSTFVIVIYIAACRGGVFTEEPECYEMVEGKVTRMSLATWKERVFLPGFFSVDKIPQSVQRITWSSVKARKVFTIGDAKLIILINNGEWDAVGRMSETLQSKFESCQITGKLLVLSKQITAWCRRCEFRKAQNLLEEYGTILPQTKDRMIFEVLKLYLEAALKRASEDLKALEEPLTEALSQAKMIEPGLVTAIVYIFAATVAELIYSKHPQSFSAGFLSRRALEHLDRVPDRSDVLADMKQKAHMNLATFYLGCNMNGQHIRDSIDISDLDKAKASIISVQHSGYEINSLSKYREVQFNLVLSIYNYRYSELSPLEKVRLLGKSFSHAEKAGRLADASQFMEMSEWSKKLKALCTEELIRAKYKGR